MERKHIIVITFLFIIMPATASFSQIIKGRILDKSDKSPIGYVNIGVIEKNVGTVSNIDGYYNLTLGNEYDNDTIAISCIGYETVKYLGSDFKKLNTKDLLLTEKPVILNNVIVSPRIYKEKTLGIKTSSRFASAGFSENRLGYELGVIMKNKKSAKLKNLSLNITKCIYDSIIYRVNVYEVTGKYSFRNILDKPIYITISKDKALKGTVKFDLSKYNIITDGDFMVSLEHIQNLGNDGIYFCSLLGAKTYIRKTSQGKWMSAAIGISISTDCLVEK